MTLSFSTTLAGLRLYHLPLPTKSNFWHSSKCTILAILSRLCLYSFWASFLHFAIKWVIESSLSPQILHYSDTSWTSMFLLIQFVLRACSSASNINTSVSFFKQPFLIHPHVSSLTSSVSLINLPYSCFSFHCLCLSSFLSFLALDTGTSHCDKIL